MKGHSQYRNARVPQHVITHTPNEGFFELGQPPAAHDDELHVVLLGRGADGLAWFGGIAGELELKLADIYAVLFGLRGKNTLQPVHVVF